MSREEIFAAILQLPREDQKVLSGELSDYLSSAEDDLTPELEAELDRRYEEIQKFPDRGSSWEDVSRRLLARKNQQK